MIKVLFVCWGNICRSPMCEFVFKDLVKRKGVQDLFHIESRATHTDEIWNGKGNPVYPPAKEKLAEHGISCKGKRAQLLIRSDFDEWDYIIGMDDLNMKWMCRILGQDVPDRRNGKGRGQKISLLMDYTDHPRSVADPWYTRDFDTTYRDVIEGCNGFFEYLENEGMMRK